MITVEAELAGCFRDQSTAIESRCIAAVGMSGPKKVNIFFGFLRRRPFAGVVFRVGEDWLPAID